MTLRLPVLLLLAAPLVHAADDEPFGAVLVERLEHRFSDDAVDYEIDAFYGNDLHRLRVVAEGHIVDGDQDSEWQLLYSRPVSTWYSLHAGLHLADHDGETEPGLAFGLQGTAPYELHIDSIVVVTDEGLEIEVEAERDLRLSQRGILQPRVVLRAASGDEDEVAVELRYRYEISDRIAPYAGLTWEREFATNESSTSAVAGLRFWF